MKPPPRTRMKPGRIRTPDGSPLESGKVSQNWKRFERSNLLKALETLSKTTGGQGDIDYAALRKQVPTRSVAEIHAVVEGLKDKAICSASFYLKNKDKMVRKPIEMWTHMALAVTGTLNDPICSAFAQMLIVSSTEPRTLRNCDPPQDIRLSTAAGRRLGCSIPQRRMLRLSGKGKRDGTNTPHPFVVFKTPAPTIGRARRLPLSSNVVRLPNNRIPPPQQQPSNPAGTRPADTCSSPTAVTFHAAESAIVLDLLMSLPEELSLLPCTKLHKHLIQMYQRLSSPANSMEGRELFKDLQDGLSAQTGGQDMPACQQNTAQTFDSSGVQDSEEPKVAESQSSGTNNSSIQPGKDNEMGFTPLNPFSVPLQLLMRR
ncbi:snRNA-activating protein complex subunit 2 isoform X2 [Limanda limanda]|uniref:snRNA-activating protein complex subunit 2 isoform X2 n=1 Tax=Limanda limanda TaxID=27771 RepID=UPI0029C926B7|nr:snRNA-activating protein complex subunit 2 isoform X2 [Limanda limanda]